MMKTLPLWSLSLLGAFFLLSCSAEDEDPADYTEQVVGVYDAAYSSDTYTNLEVTIAIERIGLNEIQVTPPEESGHTPFKATLAPISGGIIGFGIVKQTSDRYYVFGENQKAGAYNGSYTPDEQTMFYNVIYEAFDVRDTVIVVGKLMQ